MSGLWWGCNVSINTTLCPTNWLHQCRNTPLWNLGTTNRQKREHTNTCSDLHCHRISRNMVVASWRSQASNPCRIQDGRCILCRLHSVSSIVSAVAPRKSRHQRLHPPQFASRQASPLSKVVAHRRQTTMASRLNREKSVCKVCAQCACTVSDDNLFPTTNELKGGLIKTNIYKWSQCTCSRCQCTCSRQ